jgi:phosphatidylglycerophosphate synthase
LTDNHAGATADPTGPLASAPRRRGPREALDPLMVILTVGRLALIPLVILWVTSKPFASATALAVFIGADIYDGVIGRQRGTDGPSRRALDSIVDRIAIDTVYIALTLRGLLPAEFLAFMLVRDVYCAYQCNRMWPRLVAIRADWMYKVLNLSLAAWVVAVPLAGAGLRDGLALLMLSYATLVAVDLTRGVNDVLAMPDHVRRTVISAGALRAARQRRTTAPVPARSLDTAILPNA